MKKTPCCCLFPVALREHSSLSQGLFVNHYLSLHLEQILPVGFKQCSTTMNGPTSFTAIKWQVFIHAVALKESIPLQNAQARREKSLIITFSCVAYKAPLSLILSPSLLITNTAELFSETTTDRQGLDKHWNGNGNDPLSGPTEHDFRFELSLICRLN